MSFSKNVKEAICSSPYKSNCCKRAMILGIISAKGYISSDLITVSLDGDMLCSFFSKLLSEAFSVKTEQIKNSLGGRKKTLAFYNKFLYDFLLEFEAENAKGLAIKYKCSSCKTSVLRGIFLACGRISDPEKQFCLEFSLGNRINLIEGYFLSLGLMFNKSIKQSESVLYAKRADLIEDFFGMASLQSVTYDVINAGIKKSINNRTNRLSNVEFFNIEKTVNASAYQCEIIDKLISRSLLEMLPEDLKFTAQLRISNPDASLASLARNHTPQISKSGIKHRLDKIIEIGEELLRNK